MHGPTCIFWANLTPFSLKVSGRLVSCTVTNNGTEHAGSEVVQLYLEFPSSAGEPPKQLKGWDNCPHPPGRLSALSIFLCKSVFYGAFVWARRTLNRQKRRFPARAVAELAPGASAAATISLADDRSFSVWDVATHGWELVAGEFGLMVGASSEDIRLTGTISSGRPAGLSGPARGG